MQSKIQVLSSENRSGRSKQGNDYNLTICQCVATVVDENTGGEKLQVCEVILPKGHAEVKPGDYIGEFGLSIGQDKRLGGRLLKLVPAVRSSSSPMPQPKP